MLLRHYNVPPKRKHNLVTERKNLYCFMFSKQSNKGTTVPFSQKCFCQPLKRIFQKSPIHCRELDLYDIQPFTTPLIVTTPNGFLSFFRKLSKFYLDYVEPLYVGPQV